MKIVVVGLGNIGSQVIPLLGRLAPDGAEIELIDRDVYEASNLKSQRFPAGMAGQSKAFVQAASLKALNSNLTVNATRDDLSTLPWGAIHGAGVVVGALDSLKARIRLSEICWRVGVPLYLDAGVEPVSGLARMSVYHPGSAGQRAACFECSLSDADYAGLSAARPCAPGQTADEARPTRAPLELGAMAAAMLAAELRRTIDGEPVPPEDLGGMEWLIDTGERVALRSRMEPAANCRFDHRSQPPAEEVALSAAATMSRFSEEIRRRFGGRGDDLLLEIAGQEFCDRLQCPRCGLALRGLRIVRRSPVECERGCGLALPVGDGIRSGISMNQFDADVPLQEMGFRTHDLVLVHRADGELLSVLLLRERR